jgi:uncharacterized membrane protein (DUF4010 family)
MLELSLLENFLAALALGALIGLEREYARFKKRGHEFAGIRTFPLIALFGALSAYLGELVSPWVLILGIILTGGLILIIYFFTAKHSRRYIGVTTEIAGFITFFIGVLCYYREIGLAVIITIMLAVILYSRSVLHRFAEKLKKEEMADTLKFAVVAFVILPLLPNKGYGPYELFNPYITWLMVVFISAISFVGYIAMKWFGEKGAIVAGMLGGLASSTAVITNFAHRSKKNKKLFRILALGVLLADVVMFLRILIVVFVVNNELFWKLLIPAILLAIILGLFSLYLWKKTTDVKEKVELESPFALKPALKFAFFFAVIIALVKLADLYLSTSGVYVVSFFSGFTSVNAITLSLAQMAKTTLTTQTAANGILIAALTNMGLKGGIAYFMGGKEFSKTLIGFYAILIAIGVGLIFLF